MKRRRSLLPFLLVVSSVSLLTSCSSAPRKRPDPSSSAAVRSSQPVDGSDKAGEDDLDEYAAAPIADPLQPVNRAIFWVNDGVYTILLRPISKGYKTVVPKLVRESLDNFFINVKFPIRFVNCALQGNFKRALQETGKFLVNSTIGFAGIARQSDHFPALADVPPEDTGQTFAKWGIDHGVYLVLPLLGPSSLRDAAGLAGDYALNPISWVTILYGGEAWSIVIPSTDTLRAMPRQIDTYDSVTKDTLDKYLAARSSYIQFRREAASR